MVLLSHGDLQHSGLYAYAYAHWGLKAPAYSTIPVQAIARITVSEEAEDIRNQEDVVYESTHSYGEDSSEAMDTDNGKDFNRKFIASVEEVRDAFESVYTLRYSQPAHLQGKYLYHNTHTVPQLTFQKGKCQGLTITAFNAGHTLGGAIWKIRSPSAGTIVYAVDLNHLRERHLDGTVILRGTGNSGIYEALARPDLFITDADRVNTLSCRKKDRDAQIIGKTTFCTVLWFHCIYSRIYTDTITSTLMSRHSVLMPCDSTTRLLELLVLLDQHWTYSKLRYPICLVSKTGREMLTFIRSMMEWLGGTINKEDVGAEDRQRKKKRDDDQEEEALGALSLRFRSVYLLEPYTRY